VPSQSQCLFDRIHPTDSFASLPSTPERDFQASVIQGDTSSIISVTQFDVETEVHNLLSSLSVTSPSHGHQRHPNHIHQLEVGMNNAHERSSSILMHFRARVEEAARVLQELESKAERIDSLRNIVLLAAKGKLLVREITPLKPKRRFRDSEDSQTTFVLEHDSFTQSPITLVPPHPRNGSYVSAGTQTGLLDFVRAKSAALGTADVNHSSDLVSCKTYFKYLCDVERELAELQLVDVNTTASPTKFATKMQNALKRKKKLEEKMHELDLVQCRSDKQATLSVPSKFIAWFKRMIVQHQQPFAKLEVVVDINNEKCNVGGDVEAAQVPDFIKTDALDVAIHTALQTSQVVLGNACHDLRSIMDHLASVSLAFSFGFII
jgi:hypothetical protein